MILSCASNELVKPLLGKFFRRCFSRYYKDTIHDEKLDRKIHTFSISVFFCLKEMASLPWILPTKK